MRRCTPKQERFCLKYLELGSGREAARQAEYSPKWLSRTVRDLLKSPQVQARLEELKKKIGDDERLGVMSIQERKIRLSQMARGAITDFITDEGVKVTKDSPNVAAISEITTKTKVYRKTGEPVIITNIKLHNPVPPIQELNKMEKIYSEGYTVNLNQNIQNMEARIVNFNAEAVAKAILEAAKLGLVPAVFGGNGYSEGADVLSSPADIQATAIPEPKD